ncbi:hypothetical protein HHL28_11810 [Aerophototrophica crusticola]|uniref:Uncharacterized protein n=1 Tax=Aerophototrophica crusticola TaxID=1709002 RepID=A0A858R8I5_9PROT|nr:hypothetical protein HHL28_11810 [Rhodospirillaceae bacterium B3]
MPPTPPDSKTPARPPEDKLDRGVKVFYLCIMVLLLYGVTHSILRLLGKA